mmetsp:Transcript_10480/g.28696  ORF Transcript_10480/g.28696 Transcript_10480/m.28696 type:complete len:240 (+) Transcript_10480:557-1276(+)
MRARRGAHRGRDGQGGDAHPQRPPPVQHLARREAQDVGEDGGHHEGGRRQRHLQRARGGQARGGRRRRRRVRGQGGRGRRRRRAAGVRHPGGPYDAHDGQGHHRGGGPGLLVRRRARAQRRFRGLPRRRRRRQARPRDGGRLLPLQGQGGRRPRVRGGRLPGGPRGGGRQALQRQQPVRVPGQGAGGRGARQDHRCGAGQGVQGRRMGGPLRALRPQGRRGAAAQRHGDGLRPGQHEGG